MSDAKLVLQTPDNMGAQLVNLKQLLSRDDLKYVRIAVAYARWDGLGLIADDLEGLLQRGGRIHFIFGADNGVTTPDSFLYALFLKKNYPSSVSIGAVIDKFCNSIFHTKLYHFEFIGYAIVLIGSPNMTSAGLTRNTEASTLITVREKSSAASEWKAIWKSLISGSVAVSLPFVRALAIGGAAGSERCPSGDEGRNSGKPKLPQKFKAKPKPLFDKILKSRIGANKSEALKDLDAASDPPKVLYLQINKYETGGVKGSPGYQVQLPVATLGAFFQVGQDQSKDVKIYFGKETLNVTLSHFENNTHRVRLRPILNMNRPGIVKFVRLGNDEYRASPIPQSQYTSILGKKCTNQTSGKSRRWGIE